LVLWGLIALPTFIIASTAGAWLGGRAFGVPVYPHLALLFLALALLNLNRLCMALSRAEALAKWFAVFHAVFHVFKIVGVIAITFAFRSSFSYVLGLLLSLALMMPWMLRFLRERGHGAFRAPIASRLFLFGWPFAFHIVSGSLLANVSRFILEGLASKREVAFYTLASSLATSIFLAFAALSSYMEPVIYEHAQNRRRSERLLGLYGAASLATAAFIAIAILIIAPYAIGRFYHADYRQALAVMPIILGSMLTRAIYLQGHFRLVLYERTSLIALGTLIAAGLNIGLNFLLIPLYGLKGAALALVLANAALAVMLYGASMWIGRVPLRDVYGLRIIALTAYVVVVVTASENTVFHIVSLFLLFVCCSVSIFFYWKGNGR